MTESDPYLGLAGTAIAEYYHILFGSSRDTEADPTIVVSITLKNEDDTLP